VTEAAGETNHEAVIGLVLLDQDPETAAGQAFEVLGDTAYGTGETRAALTADGHTPIIKPAPLRPAVTGGFTIDDFTVDESRHGDLPERAHPPIDDQTHRHVRRGLPRLPATATTHHRQRRPIDPPAPP
jgi:hypothetical protein